MRALLSTAVVFAAVALAGCASASDKTGGRVTEHVTLTLQMPDAGDPLGERFAQLVTERSGGSVRIRVDDRFRYDSRDPAAEVRLAQALRAGKEDIGYLPARAWAVEGLSAFRALLAPFTVTTYPAAQALATGPIARDALASLPDTVIGLALVPAQLRRVIATRPLTSLGTFRGLRVRVIDNPQSARDFTALATDPVEGLHADDVSELLHSGGLDAAETSPKPVLDNSYGVDAKYLTSYAIFPKFQSIVIGAHVWKRLSDRQRSVLRSAARDVVAAAGTEIPRDETSQLAQLCRTGVRVLVPTPAELASLAKAAEPAAAELDPKLLAALRALPGAGPQAEATRLPQDCRSPAAPHRPAAKGPRFPEGVFVTRITEEDERRGNVTNEDMLQDLTIRTRMRDGRWYQTLDPNPPGQGPFSGTYTVDGDELTFVMLEANGPVAAPETLRWSYFNGRLRFEIVEVADSAGRVMYAAHPWRKVG
ncbi:TRAP transporter substrate-binding protein [Solirubrobacter soli]|uniref:TRAP transporter substrate-binding protein n=1 Tax=Solirubrobacter soli TaxID=363832 RepID=UPI000426B872|nr:TRAP transporter substrate-binding protein DctP [Solirubrobacter soli]